MGSLTAIISYNFFLVLFKKESINLLYTTNNFLFVNKCMYYQDQTYYKLGTNKKISRVGIDRKLGVINMIY